MGMCDQLEEARFHWKKRKAQLAKGISGCFFSFSGLIVGTDDHAYASSTSLKNSSTGRTL